MSLLTLNSILVKIIHIFTIYGLSMTYVVNVKLFFNSAVLFAKVFAIFISKNILSSCFSSLRTIDALLRTKSSSIRKGKV